MFWFDCGVDDKNSMRQSHIKPSTIHTLIRIPKLTQSDSYLKELSSSFGDSNVPQVHVCIPTYVGRVTWSGV
jgi:hypothetical protein